MLCMWCVSPLEICCASSQIKHMCDCDDATVFFNFHIYLVFVGEFLALVPSHLPHLRELYFELCAGVRDEYIEELRAALPELEVEHAL